MFEEKDPVNDRDEFKDRLISTFDLLDTSLLKAYTKAVLLDDTVTIESIKSKVVESELKIAHYMKKWDDAVDSNERTQVVCGVKINVDLNIG